RDPDPPGLVHGLLPGAPPLERLAIGGHAIVGGIVEAEIRRKVLGQPRAELVAKGLLLGRVLEVHRCPFLLVRYGSRLGASVGGVKRGRADATRGGNRRLHLVEPNATLATFGRITQIWRWATLRGHELVAREDHPDP